MFKRFTDRSLRVVSLAQDAARESCHVAVGSEHLLVGLLREGDGLGAVMLTDAGMTADSAMKQIAELTNQAPISPKGHLPYTRRTKTVLELALRESLEQNRRRRRHRASAVRAPTRRRRRRMPDSGAFRHPPAAAHGRDTNTGALRPRGSRCRTGAGDMFHLRLRTVARQAEPRRVPPLPACVYACVDVEVSADEPGRLVRGTPIGRIIDVLASDRINMTLKLGGLTIAERMQLLDVIDREADILAAGGIEIVPRAYLGNPDALKAIALRGVPLLMDMVTAANSFYVVPRKVKELDHRGHEVWVEYLTVTMAAQTMAALIRSRGHSLDVAQIKNADDKVIAATAHGVRCDNGNEFGVKFTLQMAETAGLTKINGKPAPMWRRFGDQMLVWRAISNVARTLFADVLDGITLTPDQVLAADANVDFDDDGRPRGPMTAQPTPAPQTPAAGEPAEPAAEPASDADPMVPAHEARNQLTQRHGFKEAKALWGARTMEHPMSQTELDKLLDLQGTPLEHGEDPPEANARAEQEADVIDTRDDPEREAADDAVNEDPPAADSEALWPPSEEPF